jgi:predicted ester cyclase
MSEENKEVHRRVWEEFRGQGKMELADELLTADFVDHDPNNPEDFRTPAGAKEEVSIYRGAFPDMSATVTEQDAEGDKVTTGWKVTGTHDGDLMGIAPTGKKVEISGKSEARIEGGKVAEEWHEWDQGDMLRQIGASPADLQG